METRSAPAADEIEALECAATGQRFYVRQGQLRFNPHLHSRRSDGLLTLETIAGYARATGTNAILTEHNDLPMEEGEALPDGIGAGIEVLTVENIDVVLKGTFDHLRRFYRRHIQANLHRRDPIYSPTKLPLQELLQLVESGDYDLYGIHAHYGAVDGLSRLPKDRQAKMLSMAKERMAMEVNAMSTDYANRLAEEAAREWDLPLLYSGDAHWRREQYVATWNAVPVDMLEESDRPLYLRYLGALHAGQRPVPHALHRPSTWERVRTALHIGSQVSWRCSLRFLRDNLRRSAGLLPAASPENIPRRREILRPTV